MRLISHLSCSPSTVERRKLAYPKLARIHNYHAAPSVEQLEYRSLPIGSLMFFSINTLVMLKVNIDTYLNLINYYILLKQSVHGCCVCMQLRIKHVAYILKIMCIAIIIAKTCSYMSL